MSTITRAGDPLRKQRIGVLMGGLSAERAISLRTGKAIHSALIRLGYDAVAVDAGRDLATVLGDQRIQVAFLALHGTLGEDGCVQGLLEVLGIPYTGSGVLASAAAMNKSLSKRLMRFHGLPTPDWLEIPAADIDKQVAEAPGGYPVVVKPNAQGSTVGTHIVRESQHLSEAMADSAQYDDRVLVEAFIPGREVTVGILNGRVLPVIEVVPRSGFFDFEAKYTVGGTDYRVPAPLDPDLAARCQQLSLSLYQALGCEGVARADLRITPDSSCYLLEINTIPGMTETSLIPKAAACIGMTFEEVCQDILIGARLKHTRGLIEGMR